MLPLVQALPRPLRSSLVIRSQHLSRVQLLAGLETRLAWSANRVMHGGMSIASVAGSANVGRAPARPRGMSSWTSTRLPRTT